MPVSDLGLTSRTSADIDPELLNFLRAKVNSFVKWDVTSFFVKNPHTTDTAENLARYAGRDPVAVAAALRELARDALLVAHDVGGLTVYTLSQDGGVRQQLARLVEGFQDREFRSKAMYHVIRGG